MTSYTYATLVTALQNETENDASEYTSELPNIISLAEARIGREVDLTIFREQNTSVTISSGNANITAPSDMVYPRWFKINSTGAFLLLKDETFLHEFIGSGLTGTPRFYCYEENGTNLRLAPTPSAGLTGTLAYVARLTGLSASNTTTWLSTNHGDLLFYACMLGSMRFMKEEIQEKQDWEAAYKRALAGVQHEEMLRKRRDEYRWGEFTS